MKKLLLAALAAALLLSACGESFAAGEKVQIRSGSHGCRVYSQPDRGWVSCTDSVAGLSGVVENHPEGLGHEYNGRVRVWVEGRGVFWLNPGDLHQVPEK